MRSQAKNVENISVKKLAEFIIAYFNVNAVEITNLRLQKILYYVQAWHLVYFDGNPLFPEEPEAWVNGPVYKKIYDIYKSEGRNPLYVEEDEDKIKDEFENLEESLGLNKDQEEFLIAVLDKYGFIPLSSLLHKVHVEDPWNEARKDVGPFEFSNNVIPHELMHNYYKSLIKK